MRNRTLLTLAVIAAAGCGVSKDEFAAQQRDAQNNLKKYQAEAEKTAALEQKVADLESQLKGAQGQIELLKTTTTKLEQERTTLAAKSAEYEQLTKSLQQQIQSGEIEISELRGKMTVKLKDKILFASGSTAINKQGKEALDKVAEALQKVTSKNVIVAGFTDDVPTGAKSGFKDNWDLSAARAVSVVRYLQSKGVHPSMLGAAGFSEYRPLAPNDTVENRSVNRRIEIGLVAAEPVGEVDVARDGAGK